MKAYGTKRKDRGCCPGHDKYPPDRYNTTTADQRRRAQKSRKTRARQHGNMECLQQMNMFRANGGIGFI